jgi:hypothetical protein
VIEKEIAIERAYIGANRQGDREKERQGSNKKGEREKMKS